MDMQTTSKPQNTNEATIDAQTRTSAPHPRFLDEKQLCAELGISSVTATKWRARVEGPPFLKVGRLVRYRRCDVEAWLESRTVGRRAA
jgi:predicted DNA-binding transcriptional regulator AlpA